MYISEVEKNEIESIFQKSNIDWSIFNNKTILITGATGLIGSTIIHTLCYLNLYHGYNYLIVAAARSQEKFDNKFGEDEKKFITPVFCNIEDLPKTLTTDHINIIIHCASPTASKYFVTYPVETIHDSVYGTDAVLEIARNRHVEKTIYLSTMEVFGERSNNCKVYPNESGSFDTAVVRNSYPLSKLLCENLCISYANEFGLNIQVLRLTQTFGPGIDKNDHRIFAEIAFDVINKRDIILKTKGRTERSYLYVFDAITAIMTLIEKGNSGQVYIAANENTFCSIYEMSKSVANKYKIGVKVEEDNIANRGYANELHMNLDTSKIQMLGWKPTTDLLSMYEKMINDLIERGD